MKKFVLFFWIITGALVSLPVAESVSEPFSEETYSSTLPDSAFQAGNAAAAARMLIDEGVPIPDILTAAMRNGVANDAVVGGLLAAGVDRSELVMNCLQGPMTVNNALQALRDNDIQPDYVLTRLIQWEAGSDTVFETCDYMLKQGYSQIDVLTALHRAEADREIILRVMRWFNIPPAAVAAVFQSSEEDSERFGHVFTRYAIPPSALSAMGMSRIDVGDAFLNRPPERVISPMQP